MQHDVRLFMKKLICIQLIILFAIGIGACSAANTDSPPTLSPTPSQRIDTPTSVPSATEVVALEPTSTVTPIPSATISSPPVADFQTILENHDISFFVGGLRRTNLPKDWPENDEVTLLAPINEAFFSLPYGTYLTLTNDNAALAEALKHLVVLGHYSLDDLESVEVLETLDGEELPIVIQGDSITIGDAKILDGDIRSPLGIIHVIDSVLLVTN